MNQSDTDPTLQKFSCLTCRQRKIKCDRHEPCNNCVKTDKLCSFVAPVRGKRKRVQQPKEGLHAKLKRYEELLKSYGAQLEPSEDGDETSSDSDATSRPEFELTKDVQTRGRNLGDPYGLDEVGPLLITMDDDSRYLDSASSALWSNLGREFTNPELESLNAPLNQLKLEENDLLFKTSLQDGTRDNTSQFLDLTSLHPPDQVLPKLQDVYIDRVDPIVKVLHLPTFWARVREVYKNPRNISKNLQALVFSFYLSTIITLNDDECLRMLGAQKSFLQHRYRLAAQQALSEADVLSSSSPVALQAYILFMMGVRTTYRSETLYIMSGVALRLARKMGLHRDGSSLGLSPFESEMRRRLWCHIIHQDFRMSESSDSRPSMDLFASDVKMPANIADEDFGPDSTVLPPERSAITSIAVCLIRCEIVEFMKKMCSPFPNHIRLEILGSPDIPLARKDSLIREYEDHLERKYLRYCDPTNSLHTLVSIMVRATICRLKLMAHDPWRRAEGFDKISQNDRDVVFVNASKLLEYASLVPGNPTLEKYQWQMNISYICTNLLYVLIEARHRKTGPEIERVWQIIGVVLSKYPQILETTTGAVYKALRRWVLEVWDDYTVARRAARLPDPSIPEYVEVLQCKMRSRAGITSQTDSGTNPDPGTQIPAGYGGFHNQRQSTPLLIQPEPLEAYDFPDILSFEMNPNEWLQWEQLVAEEASGF